MFPPGTYLTESDPQFILEGILIPPTMGEIYAASSTNPNDGKKYIVKIIQKTESSINEAEIAQKLHHPHIVETKIINDPDNIFQDQIIALSMPRYSDGDLLELITSMNFQPRSESVWARFFYEVGEAICYLHDQGIIHRDIKPENVLIINSGNNYIDPVLIDFGLSVQTTEENQILTDAVGTKNYSPPEIILNRPYTMSCDMWSLGATIFTAIKRTYVFNSPQTRDFVIDQTKFDGLSDELQDLLTSLLQINPDQRINIHDYLNHPWFERFYPVEQRSSIVHEIKQMTPSPNEIGYDDDNGFFY